MNQMRVLPILSFVCLFVAPLLASDLTRQGYVLDGLVAQWDGIDNVGTGIHEPSASTWKDLVGDVDFTLTDAGSWNQQGTALVVNGLSAIAGKVAPAYRTIEIVYRKTNNDGRILFSGGDVNQFVIFDVINANNNRLYFAGVKPTKSVEFTYRPFEIVMTAAEYGDNQQTSSIFLDGESVATVSKNDTWGNGSVASIGGRHRTGYSVYPWYGEVYAIRLYNRRLTKWERANNHRVDCKRFLSVTGYVQDGLLAQWDGLDNAGIGVHDSSSSVWKNLAPNRLVLAEDGLDLTVRSGVWQDSSLRCVGSSTPAASSTTNFMFNTLEVLYENTALNGKSSILFSGGYLGGPRTDRYLAVGNTYLAWVDGALTRDVDGSRTPSILGVTWTNPEAYRDGVPLVMKNENADWGLGTSTTINLGCRIAGNSYPFTGKIHSIRAYSGKLTAEQVAYNNKIDVLRYVKKTEGRAFAWAGPAAELASGTFWEPGCWTLAQRPARELPTLGDRVMLPSGRYQVAIDEPWKLGSLTLGEGVKVSLDILCDGYDPERAFVTLSEGIVVASQAEIEFDAQAFDAKYRGKSVTLIECGDNSESALRTLATRLREKYGRRRAGVVLEGKKLVYHALPDPGMVINLK